MCNILYKNQDQKMPSEKILRSMWRKNPDGAGVMWKVKGSRFVGYQKGFMSLEELMEWLGRCHFNEVACEVAIHMRIATHGGISEGNTHPFPVDAKANPHKLRDERCTHVLMHNGVLPIAPRKENWSDSAELAHRAAEVNPEDPMKFFWAVDEFVRNNRIVVFGPEGARFFGDNWKEGGGGYLYANLNHEYSEFFSHGFTSGNWRQWYAKQNVGVCQLCGERDVILYEEKLDNEKLEVCAHCATDIRSGMYDLPTEEKK